MQFDFSFHLIISFIFLFLTASKALRKNVTLKSRSKCELFREESYCSDKVKIMSNPDNLVYGRCWPEQRY